MRWFWLSMILACGSRPAPTPPPPVTPTPSPQATPVPTQPAPVEVPLPVGAAATTPGPLSTSVRSTETPWDDRKKAMRRNEAQLLSSQEITDDTAELSRIVHLFFVPRTVEDKTGIDLLNRLTTLSRLAPYSVSSTFNAYLPNRIDYCVRPPDEQWPCDPDVATRAPSNLPPFEIAVDPSGVGRVILRDLSDAANPAWATFDSELAKVAAAPALLIDMRAAWGDDPRPLLAWLAKLAGRSQLVPLREIHRPAALDPFVAAYRARYRETGRDPAVWRRLVGSSTPVARSAIPIAVLVGRDCEAACELAARVLETYADAIVIGAVTRSGRLHRDEPALVTLPHSRIEMYFHATEYVLSTDIEAKTGPTSEWWLRRRRENLTYDGTALALRELKRRLANPPAMPCTSFRPYASASALPPALQKKISNAFYLDDKSCGGGRRHVSFAGDVSLHTMQSFLDTCPGGAHVGWRAEGQFELGFVPNIALVSRLAQSDLVDHVQVNCTHPPMPH